MWRSAILLTLLLAHPAFAQKSPSRLDPISCDEEKDCLAKLRDKASRKGRALTLKLENGQSVKFEDSRSCDTDEANCETYVLRGYRPTQGIYLVSWSSFEDGGGTIVSRKTGQREQLPSAPQFSPSGNYFVINGGEYDHQVTIWSVKAGEIRQEFVYDYSSPKDGEFWSFLSWDGESRIRLRVEFAGTADKHVETDAVLKEQGWVLNWPFPN